MQILNLDIQKTRVKKIRVSDFKTLVFRTRQTKKVLLK